MSIEKINKGDDLSQSLDLIKENIAKLKALFPKVVTEGKIDFTALQDILGGEIETAEEYYRFTWAGKTQARREAHKPSTGTLRPCKEDSVNWDSTENLYLEGDNLEVLKLLQKSYANKVKMIYIDPPYNTGKDFVYKDNYKDNLRNYQELTGQVDADGNRLSTNSDTDGRYHSNWCNMIYPRLILARNLLKDDGVIFMSIDDNEVENLKKIGNEVFGEENFIEMISIINNFSGRSDSKHIAKGHEHLLCYQKSEKFISLGIALNENQLSEYKFQDNAGKFRLQGLRKRGSGARRIDRPNMYYPIYFSKQKNEISLENKFDDSIEITPFLSDGTEGRWRWGKDTFELKKSFLVCNMVNGRNEYDVFEKVYLSFEGESKTTKIKSFLLDSDFSSDYATTEFRGLMNAKIFDSPKSSELIKLLSTVGNTDSSIILDFFSGSATTAHAVMQLNAEDGGSRKQIMVQLPEQTDEKSEAYKAGYKAITEIGKERIRRAGKKIIAEAQQKVDALKAKNSLLIEDAQEIETLQNRIHNLDIGFKVFKLDSSNIKAWDGNPTELEANLFDSQDNIKAKRTEEDVLFEILLKYGLDLTLPIAEKTIATKKVFSIGAGALFICLANDITKEVAEGIGAWKQALNPEVCRVVFKDTGFTDVEKANSVQILKRFGINEVKSI
jgi:adenine-specific DNA-methyltransferase